ncbi:hypothetical protein IMSAGC012_02460 [Lachnospiraceae bacterium]|nr:hypothetical protein IMSAGC012_02460 [Lachnospiraceae bacterium]
MEYQELKSGIKDHLNSAAEDFFMVGYFLRQISENALFTEDGYKNIWDFAKGEYGLSTSSASRFMAINARFSIDGGEHMAEKYIGMGVSKLQEMLGLPDEELEKVTQETTVREIRAMKKKQEEPKSFFGLPKAVYPEGSLIATAGCGGDHAKYTCFSCARPCSIRQEERYCRTAPLGSPFSCTQMSEEKRLDIEAGLFSDKCQHLHPELAPIREGDKEPDPCCLTCEHKTCFSRCDVAKKRDEAERKKEQEELRKQQKEADKRKADFVERSNGAQRNVRDLIKQQEEKRQQEAEEKKAAQKLKEDSRILKFYKDIYPGSRQIIANRDKAAITKEFKTLYGSTYETGKGWSCYPDKIVFRDGPEAEQIQITWGRFTTKLVDFLDRFPETEKSILFGDDSRQQEPEIIDADFKEVEPDQQEPERNDAAQEQNDEAQERNDELQEDQEPEIVEDPESYTLADIKEQLRKHEADLKAYREVGDLPSPMMQKQKILVDALQLLVEKKEFDEKEAAGID